MAIPNYNKKKILLPLIAISILGMLFGVVFYALVTIRGVFQSVAGGVDTGAGAATRFELQKMKDLGIEAD